MSLPEVTVPVGVPPFRAQGHAFRPGRVFADVKTGIGHGRRERLRTVAPPSASVSARMSAAAGTAFMQWGREDLLQWSRHFAAEVFGVGTSATQWWDAMWKRPPRFDRAAGGFWIVSGELRFFGQASDTGPVNTTAVGEVRVPLQGKVRALLSGDASGEISIALASIASASGAVVAALLTPPRSGRVTSTGDRRVTSTGDRRIITG